MLPPLVKFLWGLHSSRKPSGAALRFQRTAKMTYSEKLKDPRWQRKRLEILQRDSFTCCLCSDQSTELHVHHKRYERNTAPWDYEDSNYSTLCKVCHEKVEELKSSIVELLSYDPCYYAFSSLFTLMQSEKWPEAATIIGHLSQSPEALSGLYQLVINVFKRGVVVGRSYADQLSEPTSTQ